MEELTLREKEIRLTAIINILGYSDLNSLENFICQHSSSDLAITSTSNTKAREDELQEQIQALKNELVHTQVLLESEKERVNKLKVELKVERERGNKFMIPVPAINDRVRGLNRSSGSTFRQESSPSLVPSSFLEREHATPSRITPQLKPSSQSSILHTFKSNPQPPSPKAVVPSGSNLLAPSLRSVPLPFPSTQAGHETRIRNYPSLLRSYLEICTSLLNYRVGAPQYNDTRLLSQHPSLDFDFATFEDFNEEWATDGSLKSRYDSLKSKHSEAGTIQAEFREWKDRFERKKSEKKRVSNSGRQNQPSTRRSTKKLQSSPEKENPSSILPRVSPHHTPTPDSSYSHPKLLHTTPRKGKGEDKWVIEDGAFSTAKKVTSQNIRTSPIVDIKLETHATSEASTQDEENSTQAMEDVEEEQQEIWSSFPPSKQIPKSLKFSPQRDSPRRRTSSQFLTSYSSPPLVRHRAKYSPSKPTSLFHSSPNQNSLSPKKKKKRIANLAVFSPPPTLFPPSAHHTPGPVSKHVSSSRQASIVNPEVDELRFYALLGSPPLPAPNWKKVHQEDQKDREKDQSERDERRSKEAIMNERKRKAEEEKVEEASKKKGGKRRRLVLDTGEQESDVEQKGKGKSVLLGGSSKRRIEINPDRNNGKDYHYTEVVRNKDARQQMHAEACDCCTEYYKRDLRDSGQKVDGNHFLSERHKAMQAKLQQTSRHRQAHRPDPDPPEYWQMGFPTTQVVERINKKAEQLRNEKRDYQEAEAEQANGFYRWAQN